LVAMFVTLETFSVSKELMCEEEKIRLYRLTIVTEQ